MDLRSLLMAFWLPHLGFAFTWVDDHSDPGYNCLGKVVDAICCKDSFCKANTETECKEGNKQFLCSWTGAKCISFRDEKNNVCCKSGTGDACAKIVQGVCPDNWQVPNGCCSPDASKYNSTLLVGKPGHVCCNAPCAEMTKSGCPLPDFCAPKARAYVQQGNINYNLGFYQSPVNYAQNALIGKIIPGFGYGFGGDYGKSVLDSVGYGSSKDSQVDEITVDDLMSLLIDSLADDKDAMVYNSELTSDPFMGKTKSGGSIASMNLPNPNIFLDRIYGSPFGLSQGQMGNYPSLASSYDSYGGYGSMNTGYPGYGYSGSQGYASQYQQMTPQLQYQAWPQASYSPAQLQYGYGPQYAPQQVQFQYGPQQVQQQYAPQQVQQQYAPQQAQPQYAPQQVQQYAPQQAQQQYAPQQVQQQYAPQQVQQQYAPQQVQQYAPQQVQQQYAPQQVQQQYAAPGQAQQQYQGSPQAQIQPAAPQPQAPSSPQPPQTQSPQPGPIYKP